MDSYLKKIITIIIQKAGVDPDEINEASYFEDDLNISELEMVDILGAIEEEYHIEFEDEEKEELESVMDLVELVMEKVE